MSLCHNSFYRYLQTVGNPGTFRMFFQMKKIFDISFRSFNWRKRKMTWLHKNTHGIIAYFFDHFLMNSRISYNSLLSDFLSPRLKLRLDQTYDLTLICKEISYRKQYFCKRNKGHIN